MSAAISSTGDTSFSAPGMECSWVTNLKGSLPAQCIGPLTGEIARRVPLHGWGRVRFRARCLPPENCRDMEAAWKGRHQRQRTSLTPTEYGLEPGEGDVSQANMLAEGAFYDVVGGFLWGDGAGVQPLWGTGLRYLVRPRPSGGGALAQIGGVVGAHRRR